MTVLLPHKLYLLDSLSFLVSCLLLDLLVR